MSNLTNLIINEGMWLTLSMGIAILAVIRLLWVHRPSVTPVPRKVLAVMNLFFGVMIGAMAFGHLLAVSTKIALGALAGPSVVFYAIGIALAVPSWWLIYHTKQVLASSEHGQRTLVLNLWLVATLLALGLHNLPLAAPGLYTVWYHLNSNRRLERVILGLAVVSTLGLFVASLIFLASGQSFEQFREL